MKKFTVYSDLIVHTGSLNAAVLLCRLAAEMKKTSDVTISAAQIQASLHIGRRPFDSAKQDLIDGCWIEVDRKSQDGKLTWRLTDKSKTWFVQNGQTGMSETSIPECTKRTNRNERNEHTGMYKTDKLGLSETDNAQNGQTKTDGGKGGNSSPSLSLSSSFKPVEDQEFPPPTPPVAVGLSETDNAQNGQTKTRKRRVEKAPSLKQETVKGAHSTCIKWFCEVFYTETFHTPYAFGAPDPRAMGFILGHLYDKGVSQGFVTGSTDLFHWFQAYVHGAFGYSKTKAGDFIARNFTLHMLSHQFNTVYNAISSNPQQQSSPSTVAGSSRFAEALQKRQSR